MREVALAAVLSWFAPFFQHGPLPMAVALETTQEIELQWRLRTSKVSVPAIGHHRVSEEPVPAARRRRRVKDRPPREFEQEVQTLAGVTPRAALRVTQPRQRGATLLYDLPKQVDEFHASTIELMAGIGVGIVLSAFMVCLCSGCWQQKTWQPGEAENAGAASFANGLVDLPPVYYNGAFFRQFSWCLDASAIEKDTGALRVIDVEGRQVVRAVGRLMATPNGEVELQNGLGMPWAVLKRPVPSKRQGQLWDFRVCTSDGTVLAEVKQRSETKAVVVEAALEKDVKQRRLMTVIGNFGHRVFLTGERSIHVWTSPSGIRSGLGAQCEVRIEAVRCATGGPGGQAVVTPVRSFYVSATMSTDAPLILAVLLGLQEVQTKFGCTNPRGMAAVPEVASQASTPAATTRTIRSKNGTRSSSSIEHAIDPVADVGVTDIATHASASASATPSSDPPAGGSPPVSLA